MVLCGAVPLFFFYLKDDSRQEIHCIKEGIIIIIKRFFVLRKKPSVFQIKKSFINLVVSLQTSVIYIGIVKWAECCFIVTINFFMSLTNFLQMQDCSTGSLKTSQEVRRLNVSNLHHSQRTKEKALCTPGNITEILYA